MTDAAPRPFRVLPAVNAENEHFWLGGAEGELRFNRCLECATWIHPPSPRCPSCLSANIGVDAMSGLGTVHACTVNYQPWYPNFDPPYSVAIIEMDDDPLVRLTSNVVGCDPEAVRIGMRVRVAFEEYDGVWLPLFTPGDAVVGLPTEPTT